MSPARRVVGEVIPSPSSRRQPDRHRRRHERAAAGRPFRLHIWFPVAVLWILMPLVMALSLFALFWGITPDRPILAVARVLLALPGTSVEVQSADTDILIRLV